jgi:hypothetical protein
MSINQSSAVTAMNKTLTSIQRIRRLLARESDQLSREAYVEIEQRLQHLEDGLSDAMAEFEARQHTRAPHLFDDDEQETARFWQTFTARMNPYS